MSILDQVNETEWGTLIEVGKEQGSLTLDEVLSVLGVELTVDVLTDVESAFRPEGITLVVEVDPHTADDDDLPAAVPAAVAAVDHASTVAPGLTRDDHDAGVIQRTERPARHKRRARSGAASGDSGGSGDSVRLYLREIGQVSLIDAAQEVALAKRIEAGLHADNRLAELATEGRLGELDREQRVALEPHSPRRRTRQVRPDPGQPSAGGLDCEALFGSGHGPARPGAGGQPWPDACGREV